jgi:hypothetical protein
MPFDPISYTKAEKVERKCRQLMEQLERAEERVKKLRKESYILFVIGLILGIGITLLSGLIL